MNAQPSATVDRLIALLVETAGLGEDHSLTGASVFAELALDSVVVLELMLAAERAFAVELDAQEMLQVDAFRSVGSLAAYIDGKVGH